MGAAQSSFDARHVRIWHNLMAMESTSARMTMLNTLLNGQEYVAAAKRAGLYAGLLQWVGAQRRGEYCAWPILGHQIPLPLLAQAPLPIQQQQQQQQQQTRTDLVNIPPQKRALDALHDAYDKLGIDDSKPLTHEALRTAYKKAAAKAHPDKGGSAKAFDTITRAFTYIEEVLNKLAPKATTYSQQQQNQNQIQNQNQQKLPLMDNRITRIAETPSKPMPAIAAIADIAPITLNPKKLDMAMFNKMFEQSKLPNPDEDDGYGTWLKSEDVRETSSKSSDALRSKYNADVFNKMFDEDARRGSQQQQQQQHVPKDMLMAPGFGAELGSDRPSQYTQIVGAGGIGYTDLKYAYGEGSTFSQQVADINLEGRPKTLEQAKLEYGSAPKPMTAQQLAAEEAYTKSREFAEQQRQMRMSSRDAEAEALHARLKNRISIQ
jgi:hypothetical protein